MALTKYGLIISFSFKSIGHGLGLMDNESLHSKQIFVAIKVWPICSKTGRFAWFERFNISLTMKRFIEMDRIGKFIGQRFNQSDRPIQSGF